MLAIMTVLELPPNEFISNLVSLESQYGIKLFPDLTNAEITFPKQTKEKFIFYASFI